MDKLIALALLSTLAVAGGANAADHALTGAYELGLEDTGARMSRLGAMLVTLGEVVPVDEQLARWERVSHTDVRRVLDRVYAAAPVTVHVGPAYR